MFFDILFTFLNSPSKYFHADILLFDDDTNNVSYSGINSVVNTVNFLFIVLFIFSKFSPFILNNSFFNFSGVVLFFSIFSFLLLLFREILLCIKLNELLLLFKLESELTEVLLLRFIFNLFTYSICNFLFNFFSSFSFIINSLALLFNSMISNSLISF